MVLPHIDVRSSACWIRRVHAEQRAERLAASRSQRGYLSASVNPARSIALASIHVATADDDAADVVSRSHALLPRWTADDDGGPATRRLPPLTLRGYHSAACADVFEPARTRGEGGGGGPANGAPATLAAPLALAGAASVGRSLGTHAARAEREAAAALVLAARALAAYDARAAAARAHTEETHRMLAWAAAEAQ
jgi:hypothetical protein